MKRGGGGAGGGYRVQDQRPIRLVIVLRDRIFRILSMNDSLKVAADILPIKYQELYKLCRTKKL